ncbi:MAG TPA: transposase [Ktedonobacteraceae bacterium]|nr:transposase [Ktedonobacteraceae bacterium]
MAKGQKVYTREFKEEAVRLAQTSGKPIARVARELGISDTSIHPVFSSNPRRLYETGASSQRILMPF